MSTPMTDSLSVRSRPCLAHRRERLVEHGKRARSDGRSQMSSAKASGP